MTSTFYINNNFNLPILAEWFKNVRIYLYSITYSIEKMQKTIIAQAKKRMMKKCVITRYDNIDIYQMTLSLYYIIRPHESEIFSFLYNCVCVATAAHFFCWQKNENIVWIQIKHAIINYSNRGNRKRQINNKGGSK